MSLDFFADSQRGAASFAARRPAAALDPGPIASFEAAWQDALRHKQSFAARGNRQRFVQERLDAFREATGEGLANPEQLDGPARRFAYVRARSRFLEYRQQHPESDLAFPADEEIAAAAAEQSRAVALRREKVDAAATGWGSWWGSTLGDIAGAVADPVNLASLLFGAGVAAGVVRTALIEAGIGAVSQTAISAGTFEFRREVNPDFGVGDAAGEVLGAAAGGAVFGGTIKGLASVWQRVRTGHWPQYARDAAAEVERAASAPASPFQGVEGEALHRRVVARSAEDMNAGRPVALPEELFVRPGARPGRVYDADNRSIGVEYQVVDATELVTSHGDDFLPNGSYPQELQPRERGRAISRDQVHGIAAHLAPERLGPSPQAESGAPIVGPDGIVESGNARVLALRRAYDEGFAQAESYRSFLRSQGFDIEGMARPVLVARRVTDLSPAERIAFTHAANRATTLKLSSTERALADARVIDDGLIVAYRGGDVTAAANRDFVRGFLSRLPRAEHGDIVDARGRLSQEGARRVEAALMGRAYGDSGVLARALEDADSNVKSIAGALADGAGSWARLRDGIARGEVAAGMDITDALLTAVRLVMRARDEGRSVDGLARQAEMFGGPGEIAKMLLRGMFREGFEHPVGRKALADMLSAYADEALKNTTDARLFDAPLSSDDVLAAALKKAGREDLAGEVQSRTTPERAAEMAAASDVADATIMEAERLIAQRVIMEDYRARGLLDEGSAAGFKTAKGSTYVVNPDGTTTRNKAFRPEHGAAEQGPQPTSEKTFYVTQDHADELGLFQTQGGSDSKSVVLTPDGHAGVRYTSGPDAGKFEKRTYQRVSAEPTIGLIPVETWNDGTRVHFGNEIVELTAAERSPDAPFFPEERFAPPAPSRRRRGLVESLRKVVAAALQKGGNNVYADLGPVLDPAGLSRAAGLSSDIDGYRHTVDMAAVRHALRKHGDPDAEAARGQLAVTPEDIDLIPQILAAPDAVSAGGRSGIGRELITYRKAIGDTVFYVEEVRTGRREMAMQTMYKRPEGGPGRRATEGSPDRDGLRTGPDENMQPADPEGKSPLLVRMLERDASGNEAAVDRPLEEIFAEADEEIAAAGEIEACALGREPAK